MNKNIDIPSPTKKIVKKYLDNWNKNNKYSNDEHAINNLFNGCYKDNKNVDNIIIKCCVINNLYSTNIFKISDVANHIYILDIDDRLKKGDLTLVGDIAKVKFDNGKEKHFYSFATKYCSFHNPNEFPIYDSFVEKVLKYFRKKDHFYEFDDSDLKDYIKFKNIILKFREFYHLNEFILKQLDHYLWQVGIEKFQENKKR